MQIFFTRLKVLLKTKVNLWWAFFFPLLLGTFFYFGFGNLNHDDQAFTVNLYVDEAVEREETTFSGQLLGVMEEIEFEDADGTKKPLFNIIDKYSLEELETLIGQEDETTLDEEGDPILVEHYLLIDNNENSVDYIILHNEMAQTITKSVVDQFMQYHSVIMANVSNPAKLESIIHDLNTDLDILVDQQVSSNASASKMVIYFYALIAMICMYSSLWGFNLVKDIQADQSDMAFRVAISPTPKIKLILIYLAAAFLISFTGNFLLLVYLKFILGLDLGNFGLVTLVVLLGTIAGMALGAAVAAYFKGNSNAREGIMSMVILLLCAMAGLMNSDVKFMITSAVPILGYINPANVIVDALNSLYYFSDLRLYGQSMGILAIFSLVMIVLVILKMRRVKYDSI